MSCFSCCGIEPATTANDSIGKNSANVSIGKSRKDYINNGKTFASIIANLSIKSTSSKRRNIAKDIANFGNSKISGIEFSFSELEAATDNFNPESLVGEGGFGRVYKGYIKRIDRVVAIKQLDRKGCQGTREFFAEVLLSSIVQQHPNIVELIGYCAEGDQRILVYEFMAKGSLEEHLFDLPPVKQPLDWDTRIKIAEGAARGLEYLHEMSEPPVIYRDFKASNVLLDDNFNAKLCDFGLVKLGPPGKPGHLSTKVVGTYGYCAPEYALSGELTVKSDVYSFGVVFLEMITGRRVIDGERSSEEQNLVNWAEPLFKDRRNYSSMADSLFEGNYPTKGLHKALVVTAMCLQDEADARPYMGDVVTALEQIAAPKSDEDDASKHSDIGNSGLILRNDSLNDCKEQ